MTATRREREDFIHRMAREGVPLDVARRVLRYGATLQRLAELSCSSEWADRDRVPCPDTGKDVQGCLCKDYGSGEIEGTNGHGDVPRINVQEERTQERVTAALAPYGLKAFFQGDPRGCVVSVVRADVGPEKFESGYERGLGVPS